MNRHFKMIASKPYACHRCFADKKLIAWIKKLDVIGTCSWCGAKRAFTVPLTILRPVFEEVAEIYSPDERGNGELISTLLQEDWEIFSDRILDLDLLDDLAISILEAGVRAKELLVDGRDYDGLWQKEESYSRTLEDHWLQEIEDLLTVEWEGDPCAVHSEAERLSFAVSDVGTHYKSETVLYRGRIYNDRRRTKKFSLDEMGAPPPEKVPPQRANRKGEPVLYMASDLQTALAELRAWKGAPVAIARMKIQKDLSILDLSKRYHLDSPFFMESLRWRVEANALLNRFGIELSRPIMPHEQDSLYFASQHLCDLVHKVRYDGIAYPSAMGPGHNIVLFDPEAAIPIKLWNKRIAGITFETKELQQYEDPFDDPPWMYQALSV